MKIRRKNWRNSISLLLALVLSLTMLFGNSLTVDAAVTNNTRFFYDYSQLLSFFDSLDYEPYIYLFKVNGKSDGAYTTASDGTNINKARFHYKIRTSTQSASFLNVEYDYLLMYSKEPMYAIVGPYSSQYNNEYCFMGGKYSNVTNFYGFYGSYDGINWSKGASVSSSYTVSDYSSSGSYLPFYFSTADVDYMCSESVRHPLTGEVILYRTMSDTMIETGMNTATSGGNDTDMGGSSGSGSSSSGSGDSSGGSSSSGSSDTETKGLIATIKDSIIDIYNAVTGVAGTLRDEILDSLTDNVDGITNLASFVRGSLWDVIDDMAGLTDDITSLLRDDISSSLKDNISGIGDLTKLIRGDVWQTLKDNVSGIGDLTEMIRSDVWQTLKDNYSGISSLVKSFREDVWQSLQDVYSSISDVSTVIRSNILSGITGMFDTLGEMSTFIREGMFSSFSALFYDLFVPDGNQVETYIKEMSEEYVFIDTLHESVTTVTASMESMGNSAPVITVPLSDTFLGGYGVKDCVMDFSWFEPYRPTVLALESSFMWVMFIFNQYFGIKALFNASSSAVSVAQY